MIQLNLLPDVKSKYIKAERTKRLVFATSLIISIVAIVIVLILAGVVYGAQKYKLNNLNTNINSNINKLQNVNGLSKILTIQDQLNVLSSLHAQKPVTSRIFDFLPQITPSNVQISSLDLNFTTSSIEFNGSASSIADVNQFVDTLIFTKYKTDQDQSEKSAFSQVVLTSFSINGNNATYSINLNFDPEIFSSNNNVINLVVPKITSTRSETEQPGALFQTPTNSNTGTTE